ncbi:MAG: hypothetical protein QNJ09_12320 [Paracoccaceae bacterium]|nr:hypothetical protein [Paracoccaceae bacterium]
MCFSATASFTLCGALVPAGVYAIARARKVNPDMLPFAIYPLAFGIQQGFEGFVWLGMNAGDAGTVAWASRGFLFFSHFFWLAWVPFSVHWFEDDPARKRLLTWLSVSGFLYGLTIFLPSFLFGGWLKVVEINYSLDYKTVLIYEDLVNRTVLQLIYAMLVVGALALSTDRRIQVFAGMVAVSLLVTYAFYAYAFISIWCFFAAILSGYLVYIIAQEGRGSGYGLQQSA